MNEVKQCPCCAENILPAAIKCKHCGSNLDGKTLVQTIEKTSKSIKIKYLWAFIFFVIGLGLCMDSTPINFFGAFVILCAIILYIYARIEKWWKND